jgi:hypothetical protein
MTRDELLRLDRDVFEAVERRFGFPPNQVSDVFESVADEYEQRGREGRSSLIESLRKHARNARR